MQPSQLVQVHRETLASLHTLVHIDPEYFRRLVHQVRWLPWPGTCLSSDFHPANSKMHDQNPKHCRQHRDDGMKIYLRVIRFLTLNRCCCGQIARQRFLENNFFRWELNHLEWKPFRNIWRCVWCCVAAAMIAIAIMSQQPLQKMVHSSFLIDWVPAIIPPNT